MVKLSEPHKNKNEKGMVILRNLASCCHCMLSPQKSTMPEDHQTVRGQNWLHAARNIMWSYQTTRMSSVMTQCCPCLLPFQSNSRQLLPCLSNEPPTGTVYGGAFASFANWHLSNCSHYCALIAAITQPLWALNAEEYHTYLTIQSLYVRGWLSLSWLHLTYALMD